MSIELDVMDISNSSNWIPFEDKSQGTSLDQKTNSLAISNFNSLKSSSHLVPSDLKRKDLKTSGEIEVEFTFGNDGVEVSGHGRVRTSDDNGNYVEVKGKVDEDGNGSVSVSGGKKADDK